MAALYDDGWYVGQVTSLDESEVFVNFLSTAGKYTESYEFPSSSDEIWLNRSDIIAKLKTLAPVWKSKRCFKIGGKDNDEILMNFYTKHV